MRTKRSVLKPVFEAAIALLALLLLSPLFLVIALAIVFNTGFPIFFSQPRVGQNGTLFNILKFRTMRGVNHGPSITVGGDSRITPVGRILRKFKCDEIPQLWNVVRGEMSLVGPRPEVPQYVDIHNPLWRAVLKARPGITDPASIKYRDEESVLAKAENPIDFYERVLLPTKLALNVAYLEKQTVWSDVQMILQTIRCAVFPDGSK